MVDLRFTAGLCTQMHSLAAHKPQRPDFGMLIG